MADEPRTPDQTAPASAAGEVVMVRVRRSPKYGVFLALGAMVGILVALALTFTFSGTENVSALSGIQYSTMQVFGFLTLICVTVGLAVSGAVALVLDRVVGRRTRDIAAGHERIHIAD